MDSNFGTNRNMLIPIGLLVARTLCGFTVYRYVCILLYIQLELDGIRLECLLGVYFGNLVIRVFPLNKQ